MQEYLRSELERLASTPSIDDWLDVVRERKASYGRKIPRRKLLDARNADRK